MIVATIRVSRGCSCAPTRPRAQTDLRLSGASAVPYDGRAYGV